MDKVPTMHEINLPISTAKITSLLLLGSIGYYSFHKGELVL